MGERKETGAGGLGPMEASQAVLTWALTSRVDAHPKLLSCCGSSHLPTVSSPIRSLSLHQCSWVQYSCREPHRPRRVAELVWKMRISSHTEKDIKEGTSGAYRDVPMTSQKCAYSTLVSPAPYFFSGSVSTGRKTFQSPSALAFSYHRKKKSGIHRR